MCLSFTIKKTLLSLAYHYAHAPLPKHITDGTYGLPLSGPSLPLDLATCVPAPSRCLVGYQLSVSALQAMAYMLVARTIAMQLLRIEVLRNIGNIHLLVAGTHLARLVSPPTDCKWPAVPSSTDSASTA
jgi:hypothetical protein